MNTIEKKEYMDTLKKRVFDTKVEFLTKFAKFQEDHKEIGWSHKQTAEAFLGGK